MPTAQTQEKKIDKVRGSLIGGAIGDALGYQIEFHRGIAPKMVTRFANDIGIISDDTQMTLFTACGLSWWQKNKPSQDATTSLTEAIHLAYLDWLGTQQRVDNHINVSWIKDLPELNVLRDPGMTCIEALSSGKAGTFDEPINTSKGCGGVMRIAPIALCLDEATVGDFSARSCALTHGHPIAILSAYALGYIIYYTLNDYPIEKATEIAIRKMASWPLETTNTEEKAELAELFNKSIELASSNIEDQTAIYKLGAGWTADEAVAIAIFCSLRHQDNFKDAVIAAANHDGDSDSTAAITGNIVGARVGYTSIPDYYKTHIELKNVILKLADDLSTYTNPSRIPSR